VDEGAKQPIPDEKPEPTIDIDSLREENERIKKRLGDQGNSVGELRKENSDLRAQLARIEQDMLSGRGEQLSVDAGSTQAIERVIDDKLRPMQETLAAEAERKALSAIREAHSDYDEIVQSDGFRDWMGQSRYRQIMAQEAEAKLDADAAIELVNMYKSDTDVTPEQAVQRDRELRASATESGRGASSGARFSWTELRLLQTRDPQRYKAMMPQIMQAAREGRVDP
jgi:hypothetical protein